MLNGQVNLRDAIRRQIDFEIGGKTYKLSETPATLIVRYVSSFSALISGEAHTIPDLVGGTSMNPVSLLITNL